MTQDEFLAEVKAKVGHTCDMDRRQAEYEACDVGQTHLWAFYYDVEKRYLAERMVHLRLFEKGGVRQMVDCPGCDVRHREFCTFHSIGNLNVVDEVVCHVLKALGQRKPRRICV
ncbi:hypothetical protein B0H19DRAFT_1074241 [Mycena capillaripes]|nr:hypothetical protein B0H19DRAFT_1074241 [Mycena capillaripes]